MRLPILAAAIAGAIAFGGSAEASVINPQLSVSGESPTSLGNPPFTLGWEFTTNQTISVNALGMYDNPGPMADSYSVGIWDNSNTLLAETTVSNGGTKNAQWIYDAIGPVTLAAGGTYYIGALYLDGNDPTVFPNDGSTVSTSPDITYVGSTYCASSSTLCSPTIADGVNGFFGPNFSASSASVPEPSSLPMLLAGLGLIGGAFYFGRKKMATA